MSLALNTGGYFDATAETYIPVAFAQNQRDEVRDLNDLAGALPAEPGMKQQTYVAHTLRSEGHDASEDGTGRGVPLVAVTLRSRQSSPGVSSPGRGGEDNANLICIPLDMRQASRGERMTNNRKEGSSGGAPGTGIGENGDPSPTVAASHVPAVAFRTRIARNGRGQPKDITDALTSSDGGTHADSKPHVAYAGGVRRLLPVECCRLQGFSDSWLDGLSDSAKYRLLGNAVSVPVARWIGKRLMEVPS